MKTYIFHLQIIPIKDILPHEKYDDLRARPLAEKIKKEGCLVNPILVASLNGGKYLQLDGMNRFSAFKILGLSSILSQIIDYNDQETVELSSWVHLFTGSKKDYLDFIERNSSFIIKPGKFEHVGHRYIKEDGLGRLCTVCCNDGTVYLFSTNGNLSDKIDRLNTLVSFYEKRIVRDVLPMHPNRQDIDLLFSEHPEADIIMIFPTFTRHQIIDIVKKGKLFPAGITRHIIKNRCLNVQAPLNVFDSSKSIEQQNKMLKEMLGERKFRIYEEPTIYFE